jgi:hypothetical protein
MTSRGAEKMNPSTIGVDISKDTLAYRMSDGAHRRFANRAKRAAQPQARPQGLGIFASGRRRSRAAGLFRNLAG